MRKALVIALVISGTLVGAFVFNLVMYIMVPSYHEALTEAVTNETSIPVVMVSAEDNTAAEKAIDEDKMPLSGTMTADEALPASFTGTNAEQEEPKKLQIIDKQYHEDCGTGEGYWV
ncbi:MAG: hypothetical protein K6G10_05580, partial [Butyrivibrio sp.]|nr:hypothetical protein [Butyrivibrio sp.]